MSCVRSDCQAINEICCKHYCKHTICDNKKRPKFQVGDKVCCTRNASVDDVQDPEKPTPLRLCNGEIFFIEAVSVPACRYVHCVSKNVPLCNCPYLWQILTDFQNSFTGTLFYILQWTGYWISHHAITASLHYLEKYKCKKKTSNTRQQACWKLKDTSDQNRDKWSVQCYAVLDPSLWISGALYSVFVSGLCDLVGLPVHPQWSFSLQLRACFNLPLSCLCVALPVFRVFLVTCPSPSLFLFIFRNFASILCELHFLNS